MEHIAVGSNNLLLTHSLVFVLKITVKSARGNPIQNPDKKVYKGRALVEAEGSKAPGYEIVQPG